MIGNPELVPWVVDDGHQLAIIRRDFVGLAIKFDVGTSVDFARNSE